MRSWIPALCLRSRLTFFPIGYPSLEDDLDHDLPPWSTITTDVKGLGNMILKKEKSVQNNISSCQDLDEITINQNQY